MLRTLISTAILSLIIALPAYSQTSDDALKELQELGIRYTPELFTYHAGKGDLAVVKLFLAAGMDPDIKDALGKTALMQAARKGRTDVVNALL